MKSLKNTVCYKLMIMIDQIHNHSKKKFQEIGITYGNYVTMLFIHENPGISQASLADLNHKDRCVIGQIIDKLEEKQYVERVRVKKDRRAYTLYLTEDGEKIIEEYWNILLGGELALFGKISDEEKELFCNIIDKLL